MIKEYQLRKQQNTFEVTLYYKGVKVRVAFAGGNVYKGTMPKFRTDDLFKMKAIESSELFKNKEVVLVRTIGKQPAIEMRGQVRNSGKRTTVPPAIPKPVVPTPATEPAPVVDDVTDAGVEGGEKKEFANLGDAIMFIATEYQLQVTTESEARKVLKEHGINPTIKRG